MPLTISDRTLYLIEKCTDIRKLRIQRRGIDPEASAELLDMRRKAMAYDPSSATGTKGDEAADGRQESEWMSAAEVAIMTGISREAVGKAARLRRLPARRVGGRWLIRREDAEAWHAKRIT
jgi:excisionase family DNA binding protein